MPERIADARCHKRMANITMYIGRKTTLPTASTLPWQRVKARGMEYSGFDITPDNGKTENYTFPTLFP